MIRWVLRDAQQIVPHAGFDLGEIHHGKTGVIFAFPDELPAILAQHPAGKFGLLGNVTAVVGDEPSVRSQREPGNSNSFAARSSSR